MKLREELLEITHRLSALGLNRGTAGNVSVREGENFWITPSGMPVEHMGADDIVAMGLDGSVRSPGKPSSEWRFHRDILASRPEINAVVHTHSPFATTVACLRKEVPPLHYMMALAGGHNIRCAEYALFGSQALSDAALAALEGRKACLLANHGMIALGESLARALAVALEVETLCEHYWRTLQVGGPVLLTAQEMDAAIQQFQGYGSWNAQP